MTKRYTCIVTFKKFDDVHVTHSYEFDDPASFESVLEADSKSISSIVGAIQLIYNGHQGKPVSMVQCFMEGDFGSMGALQ